MRRSNVSTVAWLLGKISAGDDCADVDRGQKEVSDRESEYER